MKDYCKKICEINGWILQKDKETLDDLLDGLVDNKNRYGYQSCPCRFTSGNRALDRDLICPCDYAASDIEEFDTCYCNLYLNPDFYKKHKEKFIQILERRPIEKESAILEYIKKKPRK
ncbi:MAG: ferredoxin:thioredoxin reductase [Candidatus Lokiarchaeota archaeon]|nr:ferredoxin:thioredoxin reductase [Candidatus Lokiarchaeota archaeon]